jgi:acyl-CoA synthetase (AMP-forming)/AMP-acid ligase II
MRKTAIQNKQNSLYTSGVATYYRPAFVQFTSGSSGTISWVLTTSGYNGMLNASTSAGDMPGTLDYSVYGPTDKHYGTYDSSKSVYFAFLVTNAEPNSWSGLTDAYGLQSNSYFLTNITIKWFV